MANGWKPAKRAGNIEKHGIDFAAADGFQWATALVQADMRRDYGEVRLAAYGLIADRLHVLIYTIRRNTTWIISLRRANDKEVRDYENHA